MATALTHVIKFVADMSAAVGFYRDELGLELRFQSPEWSEFNTGSTTLALHTAPAEHPAGACQPGFGVPDIEQFYAEKKNHGMLFNFALVETFGHRITKFRDCEGVECSMSGR